MANLTIARTIQQQLYAFGQIKVMSWGANTWVGGDNFLMFKVQAYRHTGWVKIELNGSDLYDITLLDERKKVVKTFNNIYFDEMTDVIDKEIEYIPEYKNN